jgi:YidC/Oxa1 family membrane protein insertase
LLEPVPPEHREDRDYPGYDVRLDIEIVNTGSAPQSLAYQLDGPTGMPIEGWWYARKIGQNWSAAGLRDIVIRYNEGPALQIDCSQIATGEIEPMGQGQGLAYAGVDGLYFAAVLLPEKPLEEVWFETTEAIVVGPKPDEHAHTLMYTNVTTRMTREPIEIAAGERRQDQYTIFLGPKRPSLLAQYQAGANPDYSLKHIVYYGWPLFASVARAMLAILHFFYGIVGNYGIAIVLLTVLVRGAMFPISYKQTQNMARMQALKPEMDRINEKYKTDMQKRSEALRELYRKHNINPLGGCLPLFLQLPIFVGLYKGLMIDVELRQSPLFGHGIRWCSNLAAPDMFYDWSWFMPTFVNNGVGLVGFPLGFLLGLGPYLNILPIVTVAIMVVSQKLAMPPPTNEQAAMQQKIMKYMMIFFGLMFYKVASGLCLYLIVSSLWGIAERKLLPKAQAADAATSGASDSAPPSGGGPRRGPKSGPNGSPRPKKSRRAPKRKK